MSWEALTSQVSPRGYYPDRLGKKFCVRDATGAVVRRGYSEAAEAQNAIDVIERAANTTQRPCLCCGDPVLSEGPHHRLCNICRATPVSPYAL